MPAIGEKDALFPPARSSFNLALPHGGVNARNIDVSVCGLKAMALMLWL